MKIHDFSVTIHSPPTDLSVYVKMFAQRVEMGITQAAVWPAGVWYTRNALGSDDLPILVDGMFDTGLGIGFFTIERKKSRRGVHRWEGRFWVENMGKSEPLYLVEAVAVGYGAWMDFHLFPQEEPRPGKVFYYTEKLDAFLSRYRARWSTHSVFRDRRIAEELANIEDYEAFSKAADSVVKNLLSGKKPQPVSDEDLKEAIRGIEKHLEG